MAINGDGIKFLIIHSSYLIRKSLCSIMLEHYSRVEYYESMDDYDELISVIERSVPCVIFIDRNILDRYKYYLHGISNKAVLIPIIDKRYEEELDEFRISIDIDDEKCKIMRKISKVLEDLQVDSKPAASVSELTSRERLILQLIAKGMTSKMIADRLGISSQTVSSHRKNISNKLEIKSVSALTVYAIINNLIDIEDTNLS